MTIEHRVVREVRRLVAENPDFKYQIPSVYDECEGKPVQGDSCLYVFDGKGSCGVGQALVNTGDLDPARPFGKAGQHVENTGAALVTEYLGLRLPTKQKVWLEKFQEEQDDGKSWAQAELEADEYVYGEASE